MSNYTYKLPVKNREGATLITSLMVIALIAMLAMAATYSALVEKRIADNMVKNTAVFYAAESGLAHGEAVLLDKHATSTTWVFVFDGSDGDFTYPATPAFHCEGCEAAGVDEVTGPWLNDGGVIVLPTQTYVLDGLTYSYTVTAWNNNDGPACGTTTDPIVDCDGKITIRSVATVGKNGAILGEAVLEESVSAQVTEKELPPVSGISV